MIVSLRAKQTREFAAGKRGKAFAGFERQVEMKLDQLEAAISLVDLDLPGNRLKALKGARQGQYRIRINDPMADLLRVAPMVSWAGQG